MPPRPTLLHLSANHGPGVVPAFTNAKRRSRPPWWAVGLELNRATLCNMTQPCSIQYRRVNSVLCLTHRGVRHHAKMMGPPLGTFSGVAYANPVLQSRKLVDMAPALPSHVSGINVFPQGLHQVRQTALSEVSGPTKPLISIVLRPHSRFRLCSLSARITYGAATQLRQHKPGLLQDRVQWLQSLQREPPSSHP